MPAGGVKISTAAPPKLAPISEALFIVSATAKGLVLAIAGPTTHGDANLTLSPWRPQAP